MISTREQGQKNALAALQAVGEVGWLSATQIAQWVWGLGCGHSGRVLADRLVARLQEEGLLLARKGADGRRRFVLTELGAAVANGDTGPSYRKGYKLSQLDDYKQRMTVDYLLTMKDRGCVVSGRAGIRQAILTGALPDDQLRDADGYVHSDERGKSVAVLVVRNTGLGLVKKAIRLEDAADRLELLGYAAIQEQFRKEMKRVRREAKNAQ